jgi:hypothetical protein
MNIFINTVHIIKFTFNINNNTAIFYDNISDEDLDFLKQHIQTINMKTIYGNILFKHFSFHIIDENEPDFNDITALLKNKLYKPNVKINDIIVSLKINNKIEDHDIDPIYKTALDQLMISTEELSKEYNIITKKSSKNINSIVLTEPINESDDDDDTDDNNTKNYSFNINKIDTEKNI